MWIFSCRKKQNDIGQFEYEYIIYESPDSQKGDVDLGEVEKDTQINTKKQIDKDDKTKLSFFFVEEEHNILTLELISRGYINENDTQIFYYDKLFEELLEQDNSYKDLIQIIHYIVPRVVSRKFKDEMEIILKINMGILKMQ